METTEKASEKNLIVGISYSPRSDHFFINFYDENGVIISVKITEPVADRLSKELGIKISI